MGKKKNAIEFWRFIFAIAIVAMHFNETFQNKAYGEVRTGFFPSAGLGVDFFFILSGFLMFSSSYNQVFFIENSRFSTFHISVNKPQL